MVKRLLAGIVALGLAGTVAWSSVPMGDRAVAGAASADGGALARPLAAIAGEAGLADGGAKP